MGRKRILKTILGVVVLGVVGLSLAAWKALRVEDIPEELEAMDAERTPEDLVYEGMGVPDLKLADLRGKTALLWIEGQASMQDESTKELKLALNRWELPDSAAGYMIGDASGFGLFKSRARPFIEGMQGDMFRYPLYADWDGGILEVFKLPKGHTGVVVLDPEGEVVLRHSGPADAAKLEEIRQALDASEPDPPGDAPEFSVGALDNESCARRHCVFAFLGKPVARKNVPFIDGGREVTPEEKKSGKVFEIMRQPELRLVMSLKADIPKEMGAVLAGQIEDLTGEMGENWTLTENTAEARAGFGVEEGQTAFFIVGPDGKLLFEERGAFPMYRLTQIGEILGIELGRDEDDGDEDGDEDPEE